MLQDALHFTNPLQIAGVINAYAALLAEQAGFKAIYLSGAGIANACFGLPDLALTNLEEVLTEARRIRSATALPLLVDVDTGFGNVLGIARMVRGMEAAGVSAIHIEDQVNAKRCGHRPNKQLVDTNEMCDRLKAALDARHNSKFQIMARTDALASEGLAATLARIQSYIETGADLIFFEGATSLADYQAVTAMSSVPVLANITEFGTTPLFSAVELKSVGVQLILYPLSAFRAMSAAALQTYQTILEAGTQKDCIPNMQTRNDLYQTIRYQAYEQQNDAFLAKGKLHDN